MKGVRTISNVAKVLKAEGIHSLRSRLSHVAGDVGVEAVLARIQMARGRGDNWASQFGRDR